MCLESWMCLFGHLWIVRVPTRQVRMHDQSTSSAVQQRVVHSYFCRHAHYLISEIVHSIIYQLFYHLSVIYSIIYQSKRSCTIFYKADADACQVCMYLFRQLRQPTAARYRCSHALHESQTIPKGPVNAR